MPNILLVEDEQYRIDWFLEHIDGAVSVTGDVDEAIRWLTERAFDGLYLDHDLGTEPKVGRDVSRWLVEHPENNPAMVIVVHSVNVVSAPKIERELREAGRPVHRVPFPLLYAAHA